MRPTRWWQPSAPENALWGVLFEDDEKGWLLDLDGNFADIDWRALAAEGKPVSVPIRLPEKLPVIVGVCEGKMVSLVNCQPVSSAIAFAGTRGSLTLKPTTIVHGVHFDNAEDFRLSSLAVSYRHLDTWVAISGFQVTLDTDLYPVGVTYRKPEPIECELSNGLRLAVDFSASGPRLPAITSLHMTQQSWLRLSATEPMSYDRLFNHLHGFANLIALMVGQPITPIELSATCPARDEAGELFELDITIVDTRKPIAETSIEEIRHWDILFTLPDLRSRFCGVMQAWFARDSTLQSLYDLYFGGLHGPARYVESRFLNIFQALESYDRRSVTPDPEKLKSNAERLARILESVQSNKDKKWLADKLRHSHEPTASDRLRRLVKTFDAGWLLADNNVTLASTLRNYYTHFDPELETRLPDVKVRYRIMINLTTRLRVLCEVILLSAIGLSINEVQERLKTTRRVERHLVSETVEE